MAWCWTWHRQQWTICHHGYLTQYPWFACVSEDVDFNTAGDGVCLIWYLSWEGDLAGLEEGGNAANLEGCFALSNSITVIRNQPVGGTLTGGPYEFCIDSLPDFVDSLELSGNMGNSQYVITDTLGTILGLPPSPDSVDFNTADSGVCLIWHVSFAGDTLVGAVLDSNVSGLQGCFSISNAIMVTQPAGPCEDSITGGPVLDIHVFPNPVEDVLTWSLKMAVAIGCGCRLWTSMDASAGRTGAIRAKLRALT